MRIIRIFISSLSISFILGWIIWLTFRSLTLPVTDVSDDGYGPDYQSLEWYSVVKKRTEKYESISFIVTTGVIIFSFPVSFFLIQKLGTDRKYRNALREEVVLRKCFMSKKKPIEIAVDLLSIEVQGTIGSPVKWQMQVDSQSVVEVNALSNPSVRIAQFHKDDEVESLPFGYRIWDTNDKIPDDTGWITEDSFEINLSNLSGVEVDIYPVIIKTVTADDGPIYGVRSATFTLRLKVSLRRSLAVQFLSLPFSGTPAKPFKGLEVAISIDEERVESYVTDDEGVLVIEPKDFSPVSTIAPLYVTDVDQDTSYPFNIDLSQFVTTEGIDPKHHEHTIKLPDVRTVMKRLNTSAGVHHSFLCCSGSRRLPKYDGIDWDWDYDTLVIHHAGNRTRTPQEVYDFHTGERDYNDIGYHYLIDQGGTLFEGRPLCFKGSHVDKANSKKIGIQLVGDFHSGDELRGISVPDIVDPPLDAPTNKQEITLARLINSLKTEFSSLTTLGGHRDYIDTECPGDNLYRLLPSYRSLFSLSKEFI